MKTTLLAKLTVIAFLAGGASCWSTRAGDVTENWNGNCAACHGKDGKGQTTMGRKLGIKDFTDAKAQATFDDAAAAKAIKEGITENGSLKMKAFADKFSDDEIKALIAQVRSYKQ
ncbi:MAG: c-type cytochrome [Verrucomicrobiota bacterium]|jgi:mono/diheme cytochrome c family protein